MQRTVSEDAALAGARGRAWLVAVPEAARRPLRELMDDRLLDALLSEPVRMLSQGGDLASRRSFPVHVTAGALLVRGAEILLVEHRGGLAPFRREDNGRIRGIAGTCTCGPTGLGAGRCPTATMHSGSGRRS